MQVNSGLVVNTTAHYHEATDSFTLNSPDRGAWKNWISQVPTNPLWGPYLRSPCTLNSNPIRSPKAKLYTLNSVHPTP